MLLLIMCIFYLIIFVYFLIITPIHLTFLSFNLAPLIISYSNYDLIISPSISHLSIIYLLISSHLLISRIWISHIFYLSILLSFLNFISLFHSLFFPLSTLIFLTLSYHLTVLNIHSISILFSSHSIIFIFLLLLFYSPSLMILFLLIIIRSLFVNTIS
jgi:hypothetical protein